MPRNSEQSSHREKQIHEVHVLTRNERHQA